MPVPPGAVYEVTGSQSGEPRLEIYVRPSSNTNSRLSKEELRQKVDQDYDLKISVDNQTLNVTAKPKSNFNWKRQLSISYKIFVPQNVSTDLEHQRGKHHI